MRHFLVIATFLMSLSAAAKTIKFECRTQNGEVHSLKLISGALRFDRNVIRLEDGRKYSFAGKKSDIADPDLYLMDGSIVSAKGEFTLQKKTKSRGTGLISNKTRTLKLFLDKDMQKGQDGKAIFQEIHSRSSLLGAFFRAGNYSSVDNHEMDCHRK